MKPHHIVLRTGQLVTVECHEIRGGYCNLCGKPWREAQYYAIKKSERFNEETVATFQADDVVGWYTEGEVQSWIPRSGWFKLLCLRLLRVVGA